MALAGPLARKPQGPTEIRLRHPAPTTGGPSSFAASPTRPATPSSSFEGVEVARAESNCGASGLVLRLDAIHLDQTPLLSWRWRVDRGLDLLEEQTKAEDDFAARVYIMFELDKSRASTFQRLRHRLAKLIYGKDIPGSALNFVWTSRLPAGTVWDNPFESSAKMIALAQGAKHGLADGNRRRGRSIPRTLSLAGPPPLLGLAIMSDSDNSCQRTEARFADFKFLSPPGWTSKMPSDLRVVQPPRTERFRRALGHRGLAPLTRHPVTTLQINVGWRCDLACTHCHVEAGPNRTEMMDRKTADRILTLLRGSPSATTVDLTGGAPELNPQFRHLVVGARALGLQVIDRCNLTILLEPGQEDTAEFLAEHRVKVVASLPCTSE